MALPMRGELGPSAGDLSLGTSPAWNSKVCIVSFIIYIKQVVSKNYRDKLSQVYKSIQNIKVI